MSTTDSGVAVSDVRYELGDTENALDEGLITYHLGRAESYLASRLPQGTTLADVDGLVALEAAYRTATSDKETFTETFAELDVEDSYDVESYIEELRSRRDEELSLIDGSGTPTLRTVGTRATRSWPYSSR